MNILGQPIWHTVKCGAPKHGAKVLWREGQKIGVCEYRDNMHTLWVKANVYYIEVSDLLLIPKEET